VTLSVDDPAFAALSPLSGVSDSRHPTILYIASNLDAFLSEEQVTIRDLLACITRIARFTFSAVNADRPSG